MSEVTLPSFTFCHPLYSSRPDNSFAVIALDLIFEQVSVDINFIPAIIADDHNCDCHSSKATLTNFIPVAPSTSDASLAYVWCKSLPSQFSACSDDDSSHSASRLSIQGTRICSFSKRYSPLFHSSSFTSDSLLASCSISNKMESSSCLSFWFRIRCVSIVRYT